MAEQELTPDTTATRSAIDWPRIQAISGLGFAVFLTPHLGATVSVVFGEAAFIFVQHAGRRIYQIPLLELGLVTAFVVHFVAAWHLAQPASASAPPCRDLFAVVRRRSCLGDPGRVPGW